jgi:hypothetical protein
LNKAEAPASHLIDAVGSRLVTDETKKFSVGVVCTDAFLFEQNKQ